MATILERAHSVPPHYQMNQDEMDEWVETTEVVWDELQGQQ
jgi:hypothetical protein